MYVLNQRVITRFLHAAQKDFQNFPTVYKNLDFAKKDVTARHVTEDESEILQTFDTLISARL